MGTDCDTEYIVYGVESSVQIKHIFQPFLSILPLVPRPNSWESKGFMVRMYSCASNHISVFNYI